MPDWLLQAAERMDASGLRDWRKSQMTIFGEPWTQAFAARWYGVSERTWRRWERGELPVPQHVSERIWELTLFARQREKAK